ncbi:MAG: SAM-dependent methyltransferase [Planctomycetota bacterium]|jgi:SAM-dependent methyltransferase
MDGHHRLTAPEASIVAWAKALPATGSVLDVAAGGGRHAHWFAERGYAVTAIDRDTEALRNRPHENIRVVTADLENAPWPLAGETFDVVVVVNYLWRELLPTLMRSVAVGGHLLYETFALGNERYGRPRNPDFLLRPDELRLAMPDTFDIVEFSQGEVGAPPTAVRQRLLAHRAR